MNPPWFRMYAEFAGDPVVQSLAFEDQRHYVMVLCLKCSGLLDRKVLETVRNRIISRALGLDPAACAEAKRRLMEAALVTEKWQPVGWNKRQYLSDSSTERVRKYRKTKETGNVSETLLKRDCNGPDTDTEQSKKEPPLVPPSRGAKKTKKKPCSPGLPTWLDVSAWDRWATYRREIGKTLRPSTVAAQFRELDKLRGEGHEPSAVIDQSITHGWQGLFPVKRNGVGTADDTPRSWQ